MSEPTTCANHPDRAARSRGLCKPCYEADLERRREAGEVKSFTKTATPKTTCDKCGKAISVQKHQRAAYDAGKPVYCGRECRLAGDPKKVTLPCAGEGCQDTVTVYRCNLKRNKTGRVFCPKCVKTHTFKPRRGETFPCDCGCGATVYRTATQVRDKVYASQECKARAQRGEQRVEREVRACIVCGTEWTLTTEQMRHDVKTCKAACTNAAKRRQPGYRYVERATGYAWITTEDGRSMMEHRYVMEQALGRPLTTVETVHHKTGGFAGRSDNRIENLELWTGRHPKGHRAEDIVAYAREMLALYGDTAEQARYQALAADVLAEQE